MEGMDLGERLSSHDIANGIPFTKENLILVCEGGLNSRVSDWIEDVPRETWNEALEEPLEVCGEAISQGNVELLEMLKVVGCDYEADRLLVKISANNTLETLKFLVRNGATCAKHYSDVLDCTPLHRVIREGVEDVEVYEFLLRNKVNINNNYNPQRQGPLHLACLKNPWAAEWLISQQADCNLKNQEGMTPLHIAARYGKSDLCRMLIEGGARLDVRDNEKRNPLQLARSDTLVASIAPSPEQKKATIELLLSFKSKKKEKKLKEKEETRKGTKGSGKIESSGEADDDDDSSNKGEKVTYKSNVKKSKFPFFNCTAKRKK